MFGNYYGLAKYNFNRFKFEKYNALTIDMIAASNIPKARYYAHNGIYAGRKAADLEKEIEMASHGISGAVDLLEKYFNSTSHIHPLFAANIKTELYSELSEMIKKNPDTQPTNDELINAQLNAYITVNERQSPVFGFTDEQAFLEFYDSTKNLLRSVPQIYTSKIIKYYNKLKEISKKAK